PASVWQPEEVVLPDANCTGLCADDHISMKSDASGRVFSVVKTSLLGSTDALNIVAVRGATGGWTSSVAGRVSEHHTRSILLLDEQNSEVYVISTPPEAGAGDLPQRA